MDSTEMDHRDPRVWKQVVESQHWTVVKGQLVRSREAVALELLHNPITDSTQANQEGRRQVVQFIDTFINLVERWARMEVKETDE